MQLEKLDLLEKRLRRFLERHEQLKEENALLRQRLEGQAVRLKELEEEVGSEGGRREEIRASLDRIIGVVDQLEQLKQHDAGANSSEGV